MSDKTKQPKKSPDGAKAKAKAPPGAKPKAAEADEKKAPAGAKKAPPGAKAKTTEEAKPKAPPGAKSKAEAPAKPEPEPKPEVWMNMKEPENVDGWREQLALVFLAALAIDVYRAIVQEKGKEAADAELGTTRALVSATNEAVKVLDEDQDMLFYRLPPSVRELLIGKDNAKKRLALVRRACKSDDELKPGEVVAAE